MGHTEEDQREAEECPRTRIARLPQRPHLHSIRHRSGYPAPGVYRWALTTHHSFLWLLLFRLPNFFHESPFEACWSVFPLTVKHLIDEWLLPLKRLGCAATGKSVFPDRWIRNLRIELCHCLETFPLTQVHLIHGLPKDVLPACWHSCRDQASRLFGSFRDRLPLRSLLSPRVYRHTR
jgi:hypothetical protein